MIKIAKIVDKKVTSITVAQTIENKINTEYITYEEYDPEIHPWGPYGPLDVQVGLGWKDRLKEILGYCIFCGDNVV